MGFDGPEPIARDVRSLPRHTAKDHCEGRFDMWDTLGFSKNPYDASPLSPSEDDVDLLIGREEESVKFQTIVESAGNGTILLSGLPGVGKTSFFNIQQYVMESGKALFGKKLISARHLCPIQSDDAVHDIALRILHHTCMNITDFANLQGKAVSDNVAKAFKWLTGNKQAGYDFNLSIAGFGGGFGKSGELPAPSDTSFEALQYILATIAEDTAKWYDMDGIFIALDNVENLDDEQISSMLMAFRDTFFTIPKIWWVVIGQTGLTSLIQVLDPRVAERMTGGVELTPITSDELHQAIDRRVQKFHSDKNGKAPLPQDVHDFLYKSSLGEIRFVFNYASKICLDFVSDTRIAVLRKISEMQSPVPAISSEIVATAIGAHMVNQQIPSVLATGNLRKAVSNEINGLGLRPKELAVLDAIGRNQTATQSDFKAYGIGSGQDFSSNYLSKFYKQHLLAKKQEGRRVHYTLRGIAAIASEFGLLSEKKTGGSVEQPAK